VGALDTFNQQYRDAQTSPRGGSLQDEKWRTPTLLLEP